MAVNGESDCGKRPVQAPLDDLFGQKAWDTLDAKFYRGFDGSLVAKVHAGNVNIVTVSHEFKRLALQKSGKSACGTASKTPLSLTGEPRAMGVSNAELEALFAEWLEPYLPYCLGDFFTIVANVDDGSLDSFDVSLRIKRREARLLTAILGSRIPIQAPAEISRSARVAARGNERNRRRRQRPPHRTR